VASNTRNSIGSLRVTAPVVLAMMLLARNALAGQFYAQTNLVSNNASILPAQHEDPNLVNSWGITYLDGSPFWINDNGTGLATLYRGDGTPVSLVVTIPPPRHGKPPAAPTGIVSNGNPSNFDGDLFIFATEDGTISGWQRADGTKAQLRVDNSRHATGAVYKGLAMGATKSGDFLFATNFRSARIDVFDSTYKKVAIRDHDFRDPLLPNGYAPFGIANINGQLWITYALQNAAEHDDVAGPGHGFIDVFTTDGDLVMRFASGGALNSPWGVTVAPADFGQFSDDLLVGNFGDGTINAFDLQTSELKGQLNRQDGSAIIIDGLWGLIFGNGGNAGPTNSLFFTSGPNGETDGLFGRLDAMND
jgi:uncharacterized protein (TIGR03118 family)